MRVDKIIMEQQTDVHLEKLKELASVKIELETHKSELQSVKSEWEASCKIEPWVQQWHSSLL